MFSTTGAIALAIALQASGPTQAPASPGATDARWADNHPVTHFVQNLAHDVAALPSGVNGAILLVGAIGAGTARPLDRTLHTWAASQPPSSLAKAGDDIGNGWTVTGAAFGVWAFGKASGHPKIAHIGGDLIRALALDGLLVWPTKYLVNRTRPNGTSAYAFPSGHTAAMFTSAAVLHGHFGWKAGAPLYALSGLVGWARVRSDNHWLTDVIAGAAIGLVSGQTATADHRHASWTLVPSGAPGSAAVLIVFTPK